ncbi:MAG: hypothetical protein AB2556_24455 [Candidatus Thiodiazotropha sp.]
MPPKRELSQGQIEEIWALRGQLSAAEAKKRFGIGSTRLYRIWRDRSGVAPQQPAAPPLLAPPDPTLRRSTQNLLPYADVAKQQEQAPSPTVEDFYMLLRNRLEGLESRTERATDLLVEVLVALKRGEDKEEDEDLYSFLEDIEEKTEVQQDTRTVLEKIEQMVDTARRWVYISIAAAVVCGVFAKTWNHCTSMAPPHAQKLPNTNPPAVVPIPPKQLAQKPPPVGHLFYME